MIDDTLTTFKTKWNKDSLQLNLNWVKAQSDKFPERIKLILIETTSQGDHFRKFVDYEEIEAWLTNISTKLKDGEVIAFHIADLAAVINNKDMRWKWMLLKARVSLFFERIIKSFRKNKS